MSDAQTPQVPQRPETNTIYYVISTEKHPTYAEDYQYRYLRRSDTQPSIDQNIEQLLTIAVTKYPEDGSQINTDPLDLAGWDPDSNTWVECQEWPFYDEAMVKQSDIIPGDITGGFVLKPLTYYYYQGSEYKGTGEYKDKGSFNATPIAPRNTDGVIVKDDKYDITWNGSGWTVTAKGGGGPSLDNLSQTYVVQVDLGTIPLTDVPPAVDTGIPAKQGYYEISTAYVKGTNTTWNGSISIYISAYNKYTLYVRGGESQSTYATEDMIWVSWLSGSLNGNIMVAAGSSDVENKSVTLYIRYWPQAYTVADAEKYVEDYMLQDYDMTIYSEGADEVIDKMSKLLMHAANFTLKLHQQ